MSQNSNAQTIRSSGKNRGKGILLSSDPAKAMQDMMSTIDDLRNIYLEETKALEAADTESFLVIQDKKMQTARRYQRSILEILKRKDEMRTLDPTLKTRLEELHMNFTKDAEANQRALKRVQGTVDRLKETIRRATRDAVSKEKAVNYSNSGTLSNGKNKVLSAGLSETA